MKSAKKEKNHSYYIDNIRFFCILLIVATHSLPLYLIEENNYVYGFYKFIAVLCYIAVPTFFFLSSFLFFKDFSLKKYPNKIKNRIKSLVIPYLLFNTFFWLYYASANSISFISRFVNIHTASFTFKSLLTYIINSNGVPPMWFVKTLFLYALISPLFYFLICLTHNNKFINSLIFIALLCLNYVFKFDYHSIFYWMPVYFWGGIKGFYSDQIYITEKKKYKFVSIIILLLLLVFSFVVYDNPNFITIIYRIMSPLLLLHIINFSKLKQNFAIVDCFNSMSVLCLHYPIIEIIRKVLLMLMKYNIFWSLFAYVITIILTMIIIYVITRILKEHFNAIYKTAFGGR